MIVIGFLSVIMSLIPIHLGNRQIILILIVASALPASAGAILGFSRSLAGAWEKAASPGWIIVVLVGLANPLPTLAMR